MLQRMHGWQKHESMRQRVESAVLRILILRADHKCLNSKEISLLQAMHPPSLLFLLSIYFRSKSSGSITSRPADLMLNFVSGSSEIDPHVWQRFSSPQSLCSLKQTNTHHFVLLLLVTRNIRQTFSSNAKHHTNGSANIRDQKNDWPAYVVEILEVTNDGNNNVNDKRWTHITDIRSDDVFNSTFLRPKRRLQHASSVKVQRFRVVTATSPPFVQEATLMMNGTCLTGIKCLRVSDTSSTREEPVTQEVRGGALSTM